MADVVRRVVEELDGSGLPYAFGGALALAAWSEPRATADVDVIVWATEERWPEVVSIIRRAGVVLDPDVALVRARERGMFAGMAGPIRVDVFVPSIPFYDEAERRRVRTSVLDRQTWVHSAEVLAVFKMLFFRPKDLVDLARMLEVRGADFDRAFVRRSLVEMLGEDDERIPKWDALCTGATG